MELWSKRPPIIISPSFYIYIALFLLILPLKWLFAWAIAVLLHECAHLAVIHFCGYDVLEIRVQISGVFVETEPLSRHHELYSALAGPIGSLIGVFLIWKFPLLGFFAMIQLIFNLLPIYPSDGARVLRCLFDRYPTVSVVIEKISQVLVVFLGLYFSFWLRFGVLPLILMIVYLLRQRKTCKQSY